MLSKTVTSEQFEHLLELLGYRLVRSSGPQRVYENPEFNAIKLLPPAGQEPDARIEHLMALRKISIEKGIVDEETYERLLNEATAGSAVSRDAA